MKSFAITTEQVGRVVGAAAADELARRFNRHFDFLAIASWTSETLLGYGGLGMNDAEKDACWRRCTDVFGLDGLGNQPPPGAAISDWASAIAKRADENLTDFSFKAAARDDSDAACKHNSDRVFQNAAAAANLLSGRRRLISLVAPHSLLGFVLTILTSNLLRIETLDARGKTPDEMRDILAYGDAVVATPTLWRYLMQERLQAPDNAMAVAFGESMSPELAASMRKAGFSVLRELYGSTETGLVGWRDSPSDPFVLFDHWRRDGENLVQTAPGGDFAVEQSMDFFVWNGERSFHLGGRRDGAVQIGAINVFPEDVSRKLGEHRFVHECRIKVGQRRDGVNSLIAHIELNPDVAPSESTARNIDGWCREHLRQHERPRIFHFEAKINAPEN